MLKMNKPTRLLIGKAFRQKLDGILPHLMEGVEGERSTGGQSSFDVGVGEQEPLSIGAVCVVFKIRIAQERDMVAMNIEE